MKPAPIHPCATARPGPNGACSRRGPPADRQDETAGVSLTAGKATDPCDLAAMADPIGPDNDTHIDAAAAEHDLIVFTWGTHADPDRARAVASRVWRICSQTFGSVAGLGWTTNNQPTHPSRLSCDTPLQTVTAAAHPTFADVDPRWSQLLADTSDTARHC